jgi:tetratricopeptide (TPR) repeat protein
VPRRKPPDEAIQSFARQLGALRVSCGSPPYTQLYKISSMLPPATVSGVLNARTAPKLAFVLAFVRAVLACADADDISVPGAERDLTRWQRRWELMTAQQGAAGAARGGHDEHGAESPAQLRADVPWQLPAAPRLLIGRERELARLDACLAESPAVATPVTILLHGRAGVGKTALALAWAHRRREQFPDGQLYADFSAGTGIRELTATEVLIDFLAALGHSPADLPADEPGLAAMFRSALAERTLLVVLENAERAGDARPFLPGSGRSVVLVTARQRIRELIIYDGMVTEPVQELSPDAAIALVRHFAPALDDDLAQTVARECGYLPLSLRIAADTLSGGDPRAAIGDLIARLADVSEAGELPGAVGEPANAVGETSLAAVLSWSLGGRSRAEAAAFSALSMLPGKTFDLPEAAALTGLAPARTARLAAMLAGSHLISAIGSGRYGFHPLVREWLSRLAPDELAPEECRLARRRLFGYYLWTADAADRVLLSQRGRPALATSLPRPESRPLLATAAAACAWVAGNLSNMTAAVVQAEAADDEFAYLLPHVLISYFNLRKPWPQWQQMCQSGIRVARRHGRQEDAGHLALSLGIVLRETHRAAEAAAAMRRAFDAYGEAGKPACQAMALNNLATVYSQLGQPRQAAAALTQALQLLDEAAEPFRTAIALHNLAEAELNTGEADKALEHITRAREMALRIEDREGAAMSLATMADVHDRLGQWSRAADEYQQALAEMAACGDKFGQINAYRKLGKLLFSRGRAADGAWHLNLAAQLEKSMPGDQSEPVDA